MSGAPGQPASTSPLHQRILEFEAKYIRGRINGRINNIFGVPRKQEPPNKPKGCMTSPLPRRPMPLAVGSGLEIRGHGGGRSSQVRRRVPHEWNGGAILAQPQNNRHSDSAEAQRRLEEIMKQNGVLRIGGKEYKADVSDLVSLGELGHGTCGHVVKMQFKKTGQVIAVKQMRRTGNKEENKRVIMDLDIVLRSHDCPYIVQCLGCFITDSDVWICMELMATCLDKLVRKIKAPIPEDILGKMAVSIVKALHYLKEKQGIIHRDVKPSNVLLDHDGTVKLCDFGISGRLVDSKAKTRTAGCAAYMAPERIDPPDPKSPDYDVRADVWSFGISLVELATGKFPYHDCCTDFEVLARILEDDPPLLTPSMGFSPLFCSFVRDCLTKDHKRRPKYRKLMEHPFIKHFETADVDVASWFRQAMLNSPSPDTNRNFVA